MTPRDCLAIALLVVACLAVVAAAMYVANELPPPGPGPAVEVR